MLQGKTVTLDTLIVVDNVLGYHNECTRHLTFDYFID